ncbi:hypothetical protein BGZ96_000237 [Linnemannia gamsii]|uniref:Uncharacterized protein n=1 Tax=Linnemannia gamsii TaxID=64522 RepID=A0ABQ7JPF5_9FUNG|nr:hypothetical protein BGZ96_000237 [Linnemannia gamsii]
MERMKPKRKEHHGSNLPTTQTLPQQPPPKLIYGTSIDYQERAKRLRLTGPAPDHDLNPFNAPTVNAIENMFERVMAIATSSTSLSVKQPAREHNYNLLALPQPSSSSFSSATRTYERHQTKPEEKDTIASTSTHPRHEQPKQTSLSLSTSSRGYMPGAAASQGNHRYSRPPIPSVWSNLSSRPSTSNEDETAKKYRYMIPPVDAATTTLIRTTTINNRPTQEQLQKQLAQEPVHQQLPRAPMNMQVVVAPPSVSVPMKRPLSPELPASGDVEAASDEDVVEILSSDDDDEDERELSPEDEEHYSYSDEDEEEDEEEFEQDPGGQQVILDDDDDSHVVEHSKEPRWVDQPDEACLARHERHHHNYHQELQEIEATQEDSQEEDAADLVEDDDVVEEMFDGEDIASEPQVDEDDDEVSQEQFRRLRNEMNRKLRGQLGMSIGMGMGMPSAPRFGQRHPFGPMEPLELEDDEGDEIAEVVSSGDEPEGVDEYEDSEAGEEVAQEVIEDGEEYPSDEDSFEVDEQTYRDDNEAREIYDDGVSSGGESEVDSPLVQLPRQSASLSQYLQENLRHLESAIPPPQERYDSPGNNVVMLLDSDEEEEEEYPQDDNESREDDAELGILEYESDSQDDQGEYAQDLHDKPHQPNLTAQDGNSWENHRGRDEPEETDDVPGSNFVEADSVIQIVGDGISRDRYAHGVAESHLQGSQDHYDQLRDFTSSSSSSGFEEAGSNQGPTSDNVRLSLESYPAQETNQGDSGRDVVQESVESRDSQASFDGVQDEEMLSQPASPVGEFEVEQRSQPIESGDDHGGLSLADVIMAEIADRHELPSAAEFDTATDAMMDQEQPEMDLPSAGDIEDETRDYKELQQMSEGDSRTNAGTSQVQIDQGSASLPADSGVALIDEAHVETPLKQQEVQPVIEIDDEHGLDAFVTPDAHPESFRTPLLDRLHSIAQEENIDLQSSESTPSTSIELHSTPTFMPPSFIQPPRSIDSIGYSAISSTESGTPSTDLSDLSPVQPRRTRLARMSTMAQTVRDGQAYMDQLAARSSPNSSKDNPSSLIDSHSMDSSSSPSFKRGGASSSHGRTSANMVLLVKEAREFCAGGPSRVGSGPMEEDPMRDTTLSEETGGHTVVGQEDRASSAGSQPSTPHKSGVVDLVAELIIQSKVKGHHALRINPSSPGRSPVTNSSPSRSSSQEPSAISPMVPQHPLSQPPPHPSLGPSPSSVFTFGQGSPSKSIPASPSVGFGFGSSFVMTSKERRTSVGSASSKLSPRKGSGLGSLFGHSGLDSEDTIRTSVERVLPEVAEVEEAADEDHQDQEMKSTDETLGMIEIETPGQVVDIEEDGDEMVGEASSSLAVGAEDESDEDDDGGEDEEAGEDIGATTAASADDKGKKKMTAKTGKGKKLAPKVQAKRLKRRELFWQKKQQGMQQLQEQPTP